MLNLKPHVGLTKLVVAFDIGSTHSSVSYCILEPHRVPKVLAVNRFPAQGVARADAKVPSVLYYDKSGTPQAAGADVLQRDVVDAALSKGWTKAECWKLQLCPARLAMSTSMEDLPPLPSGKSVVDILADFIKYLFDCCKAYIQECHPMLTWTSVEHSIEYILTYPGGWDESRHLYHQAIERAGLVPSARGGQPCVYMLTEGEATLHSCVRTLNRERANQKDPQGVVIIDAGGGLIGLSMFSITRDPISCKKIAPAECRLQGSIFVTSRVRALMERKLEGWSHPSAKDLDECSREFDKTIKLVIESDREPVYIRVAGHRTHSSQHCILSGQLKLSGEEATDLFSDSIYAIIDAFEQQQKCSKIPITSVFLVGGLSKNDWVWSRLQSYFSARNINVRRPINHSKVVSRGAALYAATSGSVYTPSASVFAKSLSNFSLRATCRTPPIKGTNGKRVNKKTAVRDYLSGVFARAHMLAKKCNPREWLTLTERNLAVVSRPTVCLVPSYCGCLSASKE